MKPWMKTAALTLGLTLLVLVGVGLLVVYSGAYNIAATHQHWGVTQRVFDTLQRSSVGLRAGRLDAAIPDDSAALAHGFEHFHAMCVQCHGAPGYERGELGQGMNPVPPRLEETVPTWSDAEIFWITKNGIRLAGMPAFGPTHSDEELWAIVGFARQLAGMSADEYGARVEALQSAAGEAGDGAGGHSHAPGTPAHEH